MGGGKSDGKSKQDYPTKISVNYRSFDFYPLSNFLIKEACNKEQ